MSKDNNHEGKPFRKKKCLHAAMTEAFSLHCVFLLGFSSMPIERTKRKTRKKYSEHGTKRTWNLNKFSGQKK